MRVVGIDGFKDGWVAVELAGGAFAAARCFKTLEQAVAAHPDAAVFGVDIPIGYPVRGPRLADVNAREALKERGRSVFDTCPPALLECADYDAARDRARALGVACPSRQAYALVPRMLEAERMVRVDTRLHEVHPELCFWAMNHGRALAESKRTWNGFWRRFMLLARHGVDVPTDFADGRLVGIDDVLDAAAAAWSAHRIASGDGKSLPAEVESQLDAYGRRVAVWY